MSKRTSGRSSEAFDRILTLGAVDLTQRASTKAFTPAYERETEAALICDALVKGQSVLLLGAADVGKTAIWHEVFARIARGECPEPLKEKRVVSISTGAIMMNTKYLGEWQTRLGDLVNAVRDEGNLLLFIEDLWALRDAGRSSEKSDGFATFLRPYLERKDIVLLGESTPEAYTAADYGGHGLADDQAMIKLFNVITIEEPTREVTKSILLAAARDLQRSQRVRIEATSVERVLELSRRFLSYQAFPGKAIRLLTEATQFTAQQAKQAQQGETLLGVAAPKRTPGENVVTPDIVSAAFSRMTGLPQKIISDTIPLSQEEIHAYFDERIIGQPEAVNAVVDVVTLVKAELNDPNRPLGVLFFVGPTGVGKTELAKTLAEYLFGSKDKLIRLDMSEFMSGSSFGDLSQQLTKKQRRQSFSVLLLDEIEKAHPLAFDLFLQVFDDGRLTDATGHTVDLHNTIIIMTSNVGTQLAAQGGLGFRDAAERAHEQRARAIAAVESYFRPEFVNRIDKIVAFERLGMDDMRRIARRELGRALLREGVLRRNILLDFRDEVLDVLLVDGYSSAFGARPLQRAINELVLLPLARRIAAQPAAGEQMLEFGVVDGKIDAVIIPVHANHKPEPGYSLAEEHVDYSHLPPAQVRPRGTEESHLLATAAALQTRVATLMRSERYLEVEAQSHALLAATASPSFWDDQARARRVLGAAYHIERITEHLANLLSRAERLAEVAEQIRRHNDKLGVPRCLASLDVLERDVELAELELFAGQPGEVAMDSVVLCIVPVRPPKARDVGEWPRMLCEMYSKWATRKGYEVEVAETVDHGRALLLRGPNLVGILRGEVGLHKLQHELPHAHNERRIRGQSERSLQVELAVVDIQLAPRDEPDAAPSVESVVCSVVASADAPIVRTYHIARTQYVRDPRTGRREGRAREVLAGALDGFLLAYLQQQPQPLEAVPVPAGAFFDEDEPGGDDGAR